MWFIFIVLGTAAGLLDNDWPPVPAMGLLLLIAWRLLHCRSLVRGSSRPETGRKRCCFLTQAASGAGVLILTYLLTNVYLAVQFDRLFPAKLAAADLQLTGEVLQVAKQEAGYQQLHFQVGHCRPLNQQAVPGCDYRGALMLNRYLSDSEPSEVARAGERWRFQVRVYPLHGFVNPGQGRYRLLQMAKGVYGRGYVRHESASQRLEAASWLQQQVSRWQQGFQQRIRGRLETLPSGAQPALTRALLSGSSRGLDDGQWSLLQATGTVHLVVVSGLHLGVLLGIGWLLTRLIARVFPLDRHWQRVTLLLLPFALLLPMLLIWPGGVAVERAFLMALLLVLLRAAGVVLPALRILQLAVVVLLVSQPLYLLRPGFYYSVLAVALLLLMVTAGAGKTSVLRIQLVLLLGLLPLQSFWLNTPDLVSGLANLIAIPLVSLLILPLALLLMLLPLPGLADLLMQMESLFWQWLQLTLELGPGVWPLDLSASLLLILAAVLLALPVLPGRYPAVLALVLLLIFREPAGRPGPAFQVQLLDVGQGLAVLVQAGGRLLLYDSGPQFRSGFMPLATVLPPLLRRDALSLDRVVISHQDNDHAGGVPVAASMLSAQGDWLAGQAGGLTQQLQESGPVSEHRVQRCYQGQQWQWGTVQFRVLYPPRGAVSPSVTGSSSVPAADETRPDNDFSCVLHIRSLTDPQQSLLLTGDIGDRAERWLLASGQALQARWLVASHHGSAAGNSLAFLAAVQPEGILYSAGARNSYGHPAKQVQQRVAYLRGQALVGYRNTQSEGGQAARFREYNTADTGALTLVPDQARGVGWQLELQREFLPLRWRWQGF